MLRFFWSISLLGLACAAPAPGAEQPATRVLLTYGGHDFQQKQFFAMFDNLPGITYTRAPLPESADLLKPGLEADYDVIVMYDMVTTISDAQRRAFAALLQKGIGVVALHHNLGAHRDWSEYVRIIGGKYLFEPQTLFGTNYPGSTYAHDLDLDVQIVDRDHPITLGMADFQIHDESYQGYYTSPDAQVVLVCDHPQSDRKIAWVTRYGNSPVFYLLLGHDARAWENPAFPQLLRNGIRWTAERSGTR